MNNIDGENGNNSSIKKDKNTIPNVADNNRSSKAFQHAGLYRIRDGGRGGEGGGGVGEGVDGGSLKIWNVTNKFIPSFKTGEESGNDEGGEDTWSSFDYSPMGTLGNLSTSRCSVICHPSEQNVQQTA